MNEKGKTKVLILLFPPVLKLPRRLRPTGWHGLGFRFSASSRLQAVSAGGSLEWARHSWRSPASQTAGVQGGASARLSARAHGRWAGSRWAWGSVAALQGLRACAHGRWRAAGGPRALWLHCGGFRPVLTNAGVSAGGPGALRLHCGAPGLSWLHMAGAQLPCEKRGLWNRPTGPGSWDSSCLLTPAGLSDPRTLMG